MPGLELLGLVVLFAPLVMLLERTHRRTCDLPRAPLGAYAESQATWEYFQQIAELRQLERLTAAP